VPAEVVVGSGLTGAWFPIQTTRVRGPSDVLLKVTANSGEDSRSADLTLRSYTRITVKIEGDRAGLVLSAPAGLKCPRSCSAAFGDGDSVRLSANPAPGAVFRGWSGDCNPEGVVVVSHPVTCVATFGRE
jgi:hypothetical protein